MPQSTRLGHKLTRLSIAVFLYTLISLVSVHDAYSAQGDNVALNTNGAVATQSSLFTSPRPTANCNDGVFTSSLPKDECHTSNNSDNEWVDITLDSNRPIVQIKIYNRTNCCTDRILNSYVLMSTSPFPSGSDSASLAAARAQADFEFQILVDQPLYELSLNNQLGRYIRLQKAGGALNSTGYINILEIEAIEGPAENVDLSIVKSASDESPSVADTVIFSLVVTNNGPDIATNVDVVDTFPDGLGSIASISHSGATGAGNTIAWTIPSLGVNSSITLTYSAQVLPP